MINRQSFSMEIFGVIADSILEGFFFVHFFISKRNEFLITLTLTFFLV